MSFLLRSSVLHQQSIELSRTLATPLRFARPLIAPSRTPFRTMAKIYTPIPSLKLNDGTSIPMVCQFQVQHTELRAYHDHYSLGTEPVLPGSKQAMKAKLTKAWWNPLNLPLVWDTTILMEQRARSPGLVAIWAD